MITGNEERMNKLLSFPFGSYIMLRLEYLMLTNGDELEAKILRLIEKRMDDERRRLYQNRINSASSGTLPHVADIAKNVWVPISHTLFLYDLYDVVKSENTLKKAIKSLIAKKLVFARPGTKDRYAPTEYMLNVPLIEREFQKMAQTGRAGYQFLTPSNSDPLSISPEDQTLIPSGGQLLTPSNAPRGSNSDTLRGSKVDTNSKNNSKNICKKKNLEEREGADNHEKPSQEATHVAHTHASSSDKLTSEGLDRTPPLCQQQLQLLATSKTEQEDVQIPAPHTKETYPQAKEVTATFDIEREIAQIPIMHTDKSCSQAKEVIIPSKAEKEAIQIPIHNAKGTSSQAQEATTPCTRQPGDNHPQKLGSSQGEGADLSPAAVHVLEAWDRVNGRKIPRTVENRKAAKMLAEAEAHEEDLRNVRVRLLAQKDGWWKSRGVRLKDIVSHFDLTALGPLPSQGGRSTNRTPSPAKDVGIPAMEPGAIPSPSGQTSKSPPDRRRLLRKASPVPSSEHVAASAASTVEEGRSLT